MNSIRTGWIIWVLAVAVQLPAQAQKYRSYKSNTSFFSEAPLEDIKADNSRGISILNAETGVLLFSIPIRGFQFRKSLMQTHFNEKYMESGKYPTGTFQGKIIGWNGLQEGQQEAVAEGKMKIHGVERDVKIKGTITVKGNQILLQSKFPVALKDYNITIPRIVIRNIAEVVEVTIEYTYKPEKS